MLCIMFFFMQTTAYEMRISDWSSDVCSSDLATDLRPEARRVGYVFQDDRLFPHRRVRANLIYGLDLALPANRWMSLDEATQFLGIGHLLGRWPQSLSGGEIGRAHV